MIYEYFGSKEALYKRVLEDVYGRLGECETFLTAHPDEIDAVEAVRTLVPAYFAFLKDNPTYVRMVMWENIHEARYFDEQQLAGVRNPIKRTMKEIIRKGQAEGRFRSDVDDSQFLLSLFACCFNYFSNIHTMTRVMNADLSTDEQMQQRIVDITNMLLAHLLLPPTDLTADTGNG